MQAVNGRGREQGQSNRDGAAAPSQLPSCLYALLDAQCSAELPPPQRMRGVRLNNRELDKLVNNLGRNPATWRRSLLLHTWLQVSLAKPFHNVSHESLMYLTAPVPSRHFHAGSNLTREMHCRLTGGPRQLCLIGSKLADGRSDGSLLKPLHPVRHDPISRVWVEDDSLLPNAGSGTHAGCAAVHIADQGGVIPWSGGHSSRHLRVDAGEEGGRGCGPARDCTHVHSGHARSSGRQHASAGTQGTARPGHRHFCNDDPRSTAGHAQRT